MSPKFSLIITTVFLTACGTGKEDKNITPALTADKLDVDIVIGIASIEPTEIELSN